MIKTHTKGPWEWCQRYSDGSIYLATPDRGHLLVMDVVRKAMHGAQPRFATWKGVDRERLGGIMVAADKLDLNEIPDARLITAAPDLLKEYKDLLSLLKSASEACFLGHSQAAEELAHEMAEFKSPAIAKAMGEQ